MSSKQPKEKDPWAPLIEALRRHKSWTKGGISTWDEAVPLDRIDRTAPVQFREQLCEATLESMDATLENGGTLERVVLVEAASEDGPEGHSVRAVQPGDSMRCYLPADGNHRITVTERRHWDRARAADEARTGSPEEFRAPTILAVVIKGAPDPLALARELNIRLNVPVQTNPTESDRQRAAFRLAELHPDWSMRTIAAVLGYRHPTVLNLFKRQEVRDYLERHAVTVPSNTILEILHEVDRYAWEELAKTIAFEHWRSSDLKRAIDADKRIGATDWSHVRDAGGKEVFLNRAWEQLKESERIKLAYHYSVKQGLPDEQVVWAGYWLPYVQGHEDKVEARNILRGNSVPESWGWTPPEEPEPVTQPATSEPVAAGPAAEPEAPEPVVPWVPAAPAAPEPAATNGKAEATAGAKEVVVPGPSAEEEALSDCRQAMVWIDSSRRTLEKHQRVLATSPDDVERLEALAADLSALAAQVAALVSA